MVAKLKIVACLCALLLSVPVVSAEPAKHLGVASCASSVCHGRADAAENSLVPQNEYRIWAKHDFHSNAYRLLLNEQSQRIARNMGIGDPAEAKVCLDCHADNVPVPQRGPRFQISDGIGCEACHGGAEGWIAGHYGSSANHQTNLERGMVATEQPQVMAELCSGCHVGDTGRLANHEIMAAGHPRLRFELDTFLANMPPHHIVDADYRERKGDISGADRWLAGVIGNARRYLELLSSDHLTSGGMMPELALFDCHGCHRKMDTGINRAAADRALLPAGAVRLNDSALQLVIVATAVRDKTLAGKLSTALRHLHRAAVTSTASLRQSAAAFSDLMAQAATVLSPAITAADAKQLRTALLHNAGKRLGRDYSDAEQIFLGLETLSISAGDAAIAKMRFNKLYQLLKDETRFNSNAFAAEARQLAGNSGQ